MKLYTTKAKRVHITVDARNYDDARERVTSICADYRLGEPKRIFRAVSDRAGYIDKLSDVLGRH